MTRSTSTLALDLTFALNKYKQTGDVRELFSMSNVSRPC